MGLFSYLWFYCLLNYIFFTSVIMFIAEICFSLIATYKRFRFDLLVVGLVILIVSVSVVELFEGLSFGTLV
jgi:hypothetical protein